MKANDDEMKDFKSCSLYYDNDDIKLSSDIRHECHIEKHIKYKEDKYGTNPMNLELTYCDFSRYNMWNKLGKQ